MKDIEKGDAPRISGGETSTVAPPPTLEYPIQPVSPDAPTRLLVVPESPLP